jgi:hypothetical protein
MLSILLRLTNCSKDCLFFLGIRALQPLAKGYAYAVDDEELMNQHFELDQWIDSLEPCVASAS